MDSYCACAVQGHCYMQFNELQAVGLFLASDRSMWNTMSEYRRYIMTIDTCWGQG